MKTIVFGGSSGIGKAVACRIAKDGDEILICSRDINKLQAASEEISNIGSEKISWKQVDLADKSKLDSVLSQIHEEFGTPDRILMNGGGPPFGLFSDISIEDWETYVFQILLSNIMILKSMLPSMKPGSSVVFILSDVVRNAGPNKVLPCSLRLALCGVVKCLAMEYAEKGIRINAVSPGPVETERARSLLQNAADLKKESFEKIREQFNNELPMKRMGTPEEIAELVNFLFSEKSSYITGSNFLCDGGLTTMPF